VYLGFETCLRVHRLQVLLGFALCRKHLQDFSFWAYLFGVCLFWSGLQGWHMKTEWGYAMYFLINCTLIFLSGIFKRKIFMLLGSLGVICYIGHLAFIFSELVSFSFIMGAIGFAVIILAAILMRSRKKRLVH
jgi:hypothetical protein